MPIDVLSLPIPCFPSRWRSSGPPRPALYVHRSPPLCPWGPLQEPVAHVPAKWLVGAGLRFMNKLQPALQVRPI